MMQTGAAKIVVCDDETAQASDWRDGIEEIVGASGCVVEMFSLEQFQASVRELELRRSDLRTSASQSSGTATPFDEATVLIVDWDLFDFEIDHNRIDGAQVAYLARCYSTCQYIVGVNLDKVPNPFDLSLRDHPQEFIDLSVGASQVLAPALWTHAQPGCGFQPWSWPIVLEQAALLAGQAPRLEGCLDTKISDVLELPEGVLTALPRDVLAYLEVPGREDPMEVSIREWVQSGRSGVARKDLLQDDAAIGRVAAARLLKWFEAVVFPTQEQFIDAPHLVEKRPGLLARDPADPESWNGLAQRGRMPIPTLRESVLAQHAWESSWASRPMWDWAAVQADDALADTRKAVRPQPALVFAEDVSAFVPREEAKRFVAGVSGGNRARFIAQPTTEPPVAYIPSARLSMVT
jgi:hypothetical protein